MTPEVTAFPHGGIGEFVNDAATFDGAALIAFRMTAHEQNGLRAWGIVEGSNKPLRDLIEQCGITAQ